jgi:hypothetical protein
MRCPVIITATAVVCTFLSCTKNDLPSSGESRLSKIVTSSGDSVVISYFKYDTEGKLIRILDSAVYNHHSSGINFQYNAAGKLIKTELFNDYDPRTTSYSFIYQNGVVTEKINDNNPSVEKDVYAYDAQGRLVADTGYYYTIPEPVYFNFSYDNNENITSWQYFYRSSGNWTAYPATHLSYNNFPNPYYAIGLNYYLYKKDIALLSKYQVTQIDYPNTIAYYTYEYYSNGLVWKVHLQYNNGYSNSVTTEFFYE